MRLYEMRVPPTLEQHRDNLAKVAQKVYDEWDEHPDVYGGGGICHLIADEIVSYLYDNGFEEVRSISSDHEVHVWTAVNVPGIGVFSVDIRPYTYETGGGYSWKKIPDVVFDKSDVIIDFIALEDEKENYFGEW